MPTAHDITSLVKELGLRRHPDRIADNLCNRCYLTFSAKNYENILKLAWLLLKKGYHSKIIRLHYRDRLLAPTASG
jgi:hypothetical protein